MVNRTLIILGLLGFGPACFGGAEPNTDCRTSYSFSTRTHAEINMGQVVNNHHHLSGYLSIKALNQDETGRWWGLHFTNVVEKSDGMLLEDTVFARPFAVYRQNDGLLGPFKFFEPLTEQQQKKLKGLAYTLQFNHADIAGPWIHKERDNSGLYEVSYQKQDNALLKQKASYLNEQPVKKQPNRLARLDKINILESTQTIHPSACWLKRTQGKEKLQIDVFSGEYTAKTEQYFNFETNPQLANTVLWQMSADIHHWTEKTEQPANLTEAELAAMREVLLATLAEIDFEVISVDELLSVLKNFEIVLPVLQQFFRENTLSEVQQMTLFHALGLMDSPGSNLLLVALMNEQELQYATRFRAIQALTQGTRPLTKALTESLLNSIEENSFPDRPDMRSASLMAFGAMLNRRESNEFSQVLTVEMMDKLLLAENERDKASYLAALGNTYDDSVTDTVTNHIADNSASVRANAAYALGQIGSEKAKQVLNYMLHRETDSFVQGEVLGAIAQFELDEKDLQVVSELARNSQRDGTRKRAIEALSKQKKHQQLVSQKLSQILKTERNRENFEQAARALAQLSDEKVGTKN